jgi:hypothetical protein
MGKITGKFFVFFLATFRIVVSPAVLPVKRGISCNAVAMPAFSRHADIESGFRKHAF